MARTKGGRAGVEVEGGPELRRAFRKLGDRADDLKDAARNAATIVERRAESLVPRASGALAATIRSTATARAGTVIAGGRAMVPYAGPIHFGWHARNIEPQPFMYDALDDRRDEVVDAYRAAIDTLIRRFDAEAPD